jgi:hypothetical protein
MSRCRPLSQWVRSDSRLAERRRHGWRVDRAPGATQPRVTVRPKPPVLLGATSAMSRWPRTGIVSDNPRPSRTRRLQGSHRATPRITVISDLSTRTDPDTLAGPTTGPRSCLAAFPRPPSVPPCGFSSGFPRSDLAALARGSAGFRVRTVARLRFRFRKVNGNSRNPPVVPTFLRIFPKAGSVIPNKYTWRVIAPASGQPLAMDTTGRLSTLPPVEP